jgi:diguanylate cyclase (GGDEF)-like protein
MLQGCRSTDEAAVCLRSAMGTLFADTSGSVNLINASQNLVTPLASWGTEEPGEAVFLPDDCWALRRGHPYPEADALTAFNCQHFGTDDSRPVHTHLCVPLIAQGTLLGTIVLRQHEALSLEVRATAIAAGEQISLAIANLKLQETLRTQSLRDPLTGLFNRRYLEISLDRDVARALRRSQPLAVLMLDVDHFKRFNDDYGHDAGDTLLGKVGQLLASMVRAEDVACRYGGEEFTIIMQDADAALAMDRAEEFRLAIRALDVQHRRQALGQITVSIGVATYPNNGDSGEELLRRADRALYVAKQNGRDQVRVADRH